MEQDSPKANGAFSPANVDLPLVRIAELCRSYQVHELAVFGSALREDFRPDSDVDFLVEFEPGAPIGLLEYCELQNRLAELIQRRVDLVSKRGLKRIIRDRVLADARVIYAQ